MKKIFFLIVLIFFAISCEKKIEQNIKIEQRTFKAKSSKACLDLQCTSINLDIPIIESPSQANTKSINKITLDTIVDLMSFEASLNHINSYQELVDSFIESYHEFIQMYPDDNIPWKAEVEVQKTFFNDNIYALSVQYYTFAGGAHGYNSQFSLLFDYKTGNLIPVSKLFRNWGKLMPLIEAKLSYAQQLKDENGLLALPSNVYIYQDKVLLAYVNEDLFSIEENIDYIEFSIDQISPFIAYDLEPKAK